MPTQLLRDHDLARHLLIYHVSFSVPALTVTNRYRFKLHVILGSNVV